LSAIINRWSNTPVQVMFILVFTIIAVEGLIMYLLEAMQGLLSPFAVIAVDSLVLASILSPVLYVMVVAPLKQQISERENTESALLASKRHFQHLIDSVEGIVWEADPVTFAFKFVNLKAEEILGYPVRQWLDEATFWADHVHPEDREWAVDLCATATKEKRNHVFEYRMIAADGRTVWLRDLVSVGTDDTGNLANLRGLMVDINERKQLEGELVAACSVVAERNTFIESIINNIQSGIIVLDRDWRITTVNPYAANISGKDPDEMLGMHLFDISPDLHDNILAGHYADEFPASIFSNKFVVGYSSFPIRDGEGNFTGTIISFKDLTEVVRIRAEIHKRQRLAEMGEVVARVAHEMRNPLFGISSSAQILDMELSLDPGQKRLMDSLLSESRRLNKLVEELLESTREVRLNKRSVNLISIIDASVSVLDALLMQKEIRLLKYLQPDERIVYADFEKMEQVIINLLTNAIEVSPIGSTIELSIIELNGDIMLKVADQGEGIPQNVFDKIFDVFYTTKKHGTGLGLSISRNIIESHGGTLFAANNPAGGATFTIRLPLTAINR